MLLRSMIAVVMNDLSVLQLPEAKACLTCVRAEDLDENVEEQNGHMFVQQIAYAPIVAGWVPVVVLTW